MDWTPSSTVETEKPDGVIVQFGGQTPLKLAVPLEKAGVKIIGTSPDSIDRAENRERFNQVVKKLGLRHDLTNVNGGAVALGHPTGCSGARILGTGELYPDYTFNVSLNGERLDLDIVCAGGQLGLKRTTPGQE